MHVHRTASLTATESPCSHPTKLHSTFLVLQAGHDQGDRYLPSTDCDIKQIVVVLEGPGESAAADAIDDEVDAPCTCQLFHQQTQIVFRNISRNCSLASFIQSCSIPEGEGHPLQLDSVPFVLESTPKYVVGGMCAFFTDNQVYDGRLANAGFAEYDDIDIWGRNIHQILLRKCSWSQKGMEDGPTLPYLVLRRLEWR